MNGASWYAVYTAPRAEELADKVLSDLGYETFFPHTVEVFAPGRLVKVAYLSNYMFVGFRSERAHLESAYQVNNAVFDKNGRKKAGLVTVGVDANGDKAPFPIPPNVMRPLFALCDTDDHEIFVQGELAQSKWNRFVRGDRVRIGERSALFGLFAAVEEIYDNGESLRVRLEKSFLGKDVATIRSSDVQEAIRR